ncbi:MAG: hypothetical protein LBB28_04380 [Synergistaceae bacterium]|nr:hypothetical protein [Synergistaceae bacterium]
MEKQTGFFKSVKALSGCRLEIEMQTDTRILFDFNSRIGTVRFNALRDDELFSSVRTDGDFILFEKGGDTKIKIGATDFMDLVLVDRTRDVPYYDT